MRLCYISLRWGGEEREKEARKVRPDEDNACIMGREKIVGGERERASKREKAIVVVMIPSGWQGWAAYAEGLWEIYSEKTGLAGGDQSRLT